MSYVNASGIKAEPRYENGPRDDQRSLWGCNGHCRLVALDVNKHQRTWSSASGKHASAEGEGDLG